MKSKSETKDYWNDRGKSSFVYRNEAFYTITPIPYYYKRRVIFLKSLKREIEMLQKTCKTVRIHDFGCGDGWYLNYFCKIFPNIEFSGFDISESFIERAKSVLPESVSLSFGDIDTGNNASYDMIYSSVVFAHISNDIIGDIFNNVYRMLSSGGDNSGSGIFVLFEQTSGGGSAVEGVTYIRRLSSEYEQVAKNSGFRLVEKFTVDFTVHRLFERYLAKKLYKLFKGDTQVEQRLNANSNHFFRFLSTLACILSINPIKRKNKNYWGNTFFIFKKNG